MPPSADLPIAVAQQALLDALREQLDASRVTLRLRRNKTIQLLAESAAPGVKSMHAGTQEDASRFPTYEFLEETGQILVQDDLRQHEIRPPRSLIDEYGTLAQMLSPILTAEHMIGVISVHQVGRTRKWTDPDIAALRAISAVAALLISATEPEGAARTGRVAGAGTAVATG
jgi:maleate isomerase